MPFNEAQSRAVRHGKGPMMVLAGPGSGKTTVIVGRVRNLVENQGVSPSNILVITFTRAAAREMEERYLAYDMEQTGGRVSFGTFHSVFFRILKLAYQYDGGNIVREEQQVQFIREEMGRLSLDVEDEGEFIRSILSEISMVKGEMIPLEHYYAKNCSEEIFKQLYENYQQEMGRRGLLDFDDMLVMCYRLFRERKDILSAWQRKYQYILIDEFQDINRIQYEVVKMMALPGNNLFIVGDDDQSIYRFRGARPELMLGFPKDYPQCGRVLLDVNYRSTPQIVEAAGRLIAHNKTRFAKEIRAVRRPGRPVITRVFQDGAMEAEAICRELRDYAKAGVKWEQMAVLFRTNLGPRLLVEKLMEYNIPFCLRDELPNLFDHWIAQNMISYMKLAMGDRSRKEFLQVMNRPNRYISREALDAETVSFEELRWFYEDKEWMCDRIDRMEEDLKTLKAMTPYGAINYIRYGVGYEEFLKDYASYRKLRTEELYEVLDELAESAKGYKTFEEWFTHIAQYTEKLKEQARQQNTEKEGVVISTLHSAKGLEFDRVFIMDVNEGIIPYRKAAGESDVEEERRLLYVGMTRARKELSLFYVGERHEKKLEPSRFLLESGLMERSKEL